MTKPQFPRVVTGLLVLTASALPAQAVRGVRRDRVPGREAPLRVTAVAKYGAGCPRPLPNMEWTVTWPADPEFKGTYLVRGQRFEANDPQVPPMQWPMPSTPGHTADISFGRSSDEGGGTSSASPAAMVQLPASQHSILAQTPGLYAYAVTVTATPPAGATGPAGLPRAGRVWLMGGAWVPEHVELGTTATPQDPRVIIVSWRFVGADQQLSQGSDVGRRAQLIVRRHGSGALVTDRMISSKDSFRAPESGSYDVRVSAQATTQARSCGWEAPKSELLSDSTTITVH